LARLWLQGEQDWIKNVEAKESDRPAMLFSTGGAVENITEMDNGPKPRVPAGSDHTDRLCPICQEKIEVVWDDDADEWMYNDAVTATDGAIMHASCAKK
jgi:pre-mRNA cleavage complex 2 protein Pcf11